MEKARPLADDIARRMKVQITGIDSVSSSASPGPNNFFSSAVNPLDEIPYENLSSCIEGVPVRVRVDVRYTYK